MDLREVLNAIRYMTRAGGGCGTLPKDLPLWQTVYWSFRRFARLLLFRTIHNIAQMRDRERAGRETSPSAGIVDSLTAEPSALGAERGLMRPKHGRAQAPNRGRHRWAAADRSHAG